MPNEFLTDVQELRRRAREHVENGAVTDAYKADRETVIQLLNEALATEIVCTLRYKRHYYTAQGIHSRAVAEEFLEHANEEQEHADWIAERITQLGGEPDYDPSGLVTRSHSEYVEGNSLVEMIREDLIAERVAIDSYAEIVRYLGERDSTTRRLMEKILANEEEHAEDLLQLLSHIGHDLEPEATEPTGIEGPEATAVPGMEAAPRERDLGYGPSHGYDPTRGGPSGPGDAPSPGSGER